MNHATWHKQIKRGLALTDTKPERALQVFEKLANDVETELTTSIQDWHLEQTRHLLSLVQGQIGDYRAAANTLRKVVDQCEQHLVYQQRAFVSASAAAAVELAKGGNRAGARRMLKNAAPVALMLRPKDKLLEPARRLVFGHATPKRTESKRR